MEKYYCSECGALLNDQNGFNLASEEWTCLECGCEFETDGEEEIGGILGKGLNLLLKVAGIALDIVDVAKNSKIPKVSDPTVDYECPCCGEEINEQNGFDNGYYWVCTNCEKKLIYEKDEDEYVELTEDAE